MPEWLNSAMIFVVRCCGDGARSSNEKRDTRRNQMKLRYANRSPTNRDFDVVVVLGGGFVVTDYHIG